MLMLVLLLLRDGYYAEDKTFLEVLMRICFLLLGLLMVWATALLHLLYQIFVGVVFLVRMIWMVLRLIVLLMLLVALRARALVLLEEIKDCISIPILRMRIRILKMRIRILKIAIIIHKIVIDIILVQDQTLLLVVAAGPG